MACFSMKWFSAQASEVDWKDIFGKPMATVSYDRCGYNKGASILNQGEG